MKKFIPAIFAGILLLAAIGYSLVSESGYVSQLSDQQDQILELNSQISIKEAAVSSKQTQAIENSAGLSTSRVQADIAVLTDFFETVFSWENAEEYNVARSEAMETYGLTEDDEFMRTFLVPDVTAETDEGRMSNIDTQGLNSRWESNHVVCTGFSGNTYQYMVEVTYTSHDGAGNEATGYAMVTCSTDAEQHISNLKGYLVAE